MQDLQPSRNRQIDLLIGACLSLVYLMFTLPWIYHSGFGEPDSAAIAVGIQQARMSGQFFQNSLLYLPSGHPLFYWFSFSLPGQILGSIDRLIYFLNHLSWFSMGLSLGLLYLINRQFASITWSVLGVIVVMVCPIIFESSTYGHPVTLALCPFMLSLLLVAIMAKQAPFALNYRQWLLGVGAGVGLALALGIRADIICLFPALLGVIYLASHQIKRSLLLGASISLPAMAFYAVVSKMAAGTSDPSGTNPVQQLASFLSTYYHVGLLLGGMSRFIFHAATPWLAFLLVCITVGLSWCRQWKTFTIGLLFVVPPLLFFIGNPFPARHFLHAIIGASLFITIGGQHIGQLSRMRASILVVISILLGIGFFPLYDIVDTPTINGIPKGSISSELNKRVFAWHRAKQNYLDWDQTRWKQLLPVLPENALMIGSWLDMSGIMVGSARQNLKIDRQVLKKGAGTQLFKIQADRQTYYFWEWYPGSPANLVPDNYSTVFILAPYTPMQLQPLNIQGTTVAAPDRLLLGSY